MTVMSQQYLAGVRLRVSDAGGNMITDPIKAGCVGICVCFYIRVRTFLLVRLERMIRKLVRPDRTAWLNIINHATMLPQK